MKPESYYVRVSLSAVVIIVSVAMVVPMTAFKVLEGVYLAVAFAKDWLRQIWKAPGVGKRNPD